MLDNRSCLALEDNFNIVLLRHVYMFASPPFPPPRLESEAGLLAKPNLPLCQVIFDPGAKQNLTHVDIRPRTCFAKQSLPAKFPVGFTPLGSLSRMRHSAMPWL